MVSGHLKEKKNKLSRGDKRRSAGKKLASHEPSRDSVKITGGRKGSSMRESQNKETWLMLHTRTLDVEQHNIYFRSVLFSSFPGVSQKVFFNLFI